METTEMKNQKFKGAIEITKLFRRILNKKRSQRDLRTLKMNRSTTDGYLPWCELLFWTYDFDIYSSGRSDNPPVVSDKLLCNKLSSYFEKKFGKDLKNFKNWTDIRNELQIAKEQEGLEDSSFALADQDELVGDEVSSSLTPSTVSY
jgi:hypothetical protein